MGSELALPTEEESLVPGLAQEGRELVHTPDFEPEAEDEERSHDLEIHEQATRPNPFNRRYSFDSDEACIWLYRKFREVGNRWRPERGRGQNHNPVSWARLGDMFAERYNLEKTPAPATILRWTRKGWDLVARSFAEEQENRLAQRTTDLELILSDAMLMVNSAKDARDYMGQPRIDMKLLDKGTKRALEVLDRLILLEGLDAPVKQAIKMEHSGKATVQHELTSGDELIDAMMERAAEKALERQQQLQKAGLQPIIEGEAWDEEEE